MNARLYNGHALEVLRRLDAESVDCCVTSPPYWGLRDYGPRAVRVWGGFANCRHAWTEHIQPAANGIVHANGMTGKSLSIRSATRRPKRSEFCARCGAWRGQLGLEPTPTLFVQHLVEIFREVRRVLKPTGTLWVNLGDSYASGKGKCFNPGGGTAGFQNYLKHNGVINCSRLNRSDLDHIGLKPKDLVGIPWRVAFALQADGWYLRSDIIWHKPNPMPESVRDRPTKCHEYLFMLSKAERYYYDVGAIREPHGYNRWSRTRRQDAAVLKGAYNGQAGKSSLLRAGKDKDFFPNGGRNRRSVWTVPTKPSGVKHFATFPPKLIEPAILAACPEGGAVLDCFAGVCTTGIVCAEHRRRFIGIEAIPKWLTVGKRRMATKAVPA